MIHVLVAPDKFKDCLTSSQVCEAVEQGLKDYAIHCVFLPLADGGDGTLDVFTRCFKAEKISVQVHDPLFRKIEAFYARSIDGQKAFIEMASASGLHLLRPAERHCVDTTSLGTGELIVHAIEHGAKTIMIGIGGSATNDGGMGAATALGYKFLDKRNISLTPIGKELVNVRSIDASGVHDLLSAVKIIAICDVHNPLTGATGAAYTFGQQKGASLPELECLDNGLDNFSSIIKNVLQVDIATIPGAGAGGGFGGGAVAFFNASLCSGADMILQITDFETQLAKADVVITGEGKLDAQTLYGKLVANIARRAKQRNKPVLIITGKNELRDDALTSFGIHKVWALTDVAASEAQAITHAFSLLKTLAAQEIGHYICPK